MEMTFSMVVHIAGGGFALIAGAAALINRKGSPSHRQAGLLFVLSMVMMTLSGTWISWQHETMISMLAGLMSFYLVVSGWLTVKTPPEHRRWVTFVLFFIGAGVFAFGAVLVSRVLDGPLDFIGDYQVPATVYIIFTLFVGLGVIGDAIVLAKPKLSRSYLLSRHIWRMCVPLYIAASSFFEGQADVFPETLRYTLYLSLPEYAVLAAMVYWLLLPVFRPFANKLRGWRSRFL